MILTTDERAIHKRVEMLERDRTALAAEVAALRMALGCIGIVAGTSQFPESGLRVEIKAIVDLAVNHVS